MQRYTTRQDSKGFFLRIVSLTHIPVEPASAATEKSGSCLREIDGFGEKCHRVVDKRDVRNDAVGGDRDQT